MIIDTKKIASEIKKYLIAEYMNMIDNANPANSIESYPNPDDDGYPELKRFAASFSDAFDEADKVFESKGKSSVNKILKPLDDVLATAVDIVNADSAFWESIRALVMPLYVSVKDAPKINPWENRWSFLEMWYDPVPLKVTTKQILRHEDTGEKIDSYVLRERVIPAGFVIKIH